MRDIKLKPWCAALSLIILLAACSQRPADVSSQFYGLYARATSDTTVEISLPYDVAWYGQPYPDYYQIDPDLSITSIDTSRASSGTITLTTEPQTDELYTLTLYPEPEPIEGQPLGGPLTTTFTGGGQDDGDYSPVVPETTEVLSSSDRASITSYTGSSLRLAAGSSLAGRVRAGDVLVSEPIPGVAPYGFLRKVTAVSGTTLSLTDAALEEAVEQGALDEAFTLSTSDIVSSTLDNRVFVEEGTLSAQGLDLINLRVDNFVLCDTDGSPTSTNDQLTLSGSIQAGISPYIDGRIRWFSLRRFEAGLEVDESVNLEVEGECGKEVKKEHKLETINFKTFVFFIGPVPVVVTPTVEIYIGAKGKVSFELSYEISQSFEADYGVRWERGDGWRTISDTTHRFDHTSPSFKGKAEVRGHVGVRGGLKFYGVAYAYVAPELYAKATAEFDVTGKTYEYCFKGGIDLRVGAKVSIFKKDLGKWESDPFLDIKLLEECGDGDLGGGAPTPTPPAPTSSDLTCAPVGMDIQCLISYTGSPITATTWTLSQGALYYGGTTQAYFGQCTPGSYVYVQANITYGGSRTTVLTASVRCP